MYALAPTSIGQGVYCWCEKMGVRMWWPCRLLRCSRRGEVMQAPWPLTSCLPWVAGMQMLSWYALLLFSCIFRILAMQQSVCIANRVARCPQVCYNVTTCVRTTLLLRQSACICVWYHMQLALTCQSLSSNPQSVCAEASLCHAGLCRDL